jgi:hypothetical protein
MHTWRPLNEIPRDVVSGDDDDNRDGTKGTDLYLSVTSRRTVPPNPYRT